MHPSIIIAIILYRSYASIALLRIIRASFRIVYSDHAAIARKTLHFFVLSTRKMVEITLECIASICSKSFSNHFLVEKIHFFVCAHRDAKVRKNETFIYRRHQDNSITFKEANLHGSQEEEGSEEEAVSTASLPISSLFFFLSNPSRREKHALATALSCVFFR
jgi:hypothetical protein